MCELTAIIGLASSVVSGIGAMQQGQAQAQAAEYNAAVQRENARRAERQAQMTLEAGQQEEAKQKKVTSELMGKQMASMSANGVDTTFGSPMDTIIDTAKLGAADALTIRTNAYRNYDDVRAQATGNRNQAALYDMQAANSRTSGMLSAFGTCLS